VAHHRDEDLTLFQAFFALALGVGLLDLSKAVFDAWMQVNEHVLPLRWALVVTLLAAGVLLVALRMTWAVESLGRFMAAQRADKHPVHPCCVSVWHYPALLAHAFVVFVLCRIAALVADPKRLGHALFPFFAVLAGLLLFNALYLVTVVPSQTAADRRDAKKMHFDGGRNIKIGWIVNNAGFGILIAGVLIISKLAGRSPSDCCVLWLLIEAMFANSFLDLGFSSRYYVPRH
jgi:hypothetical protein